MMDNENIIIVINKSNNDRKHFIHFWPSEQQCKGLCLAKKTE